MIGSLKSYVLTGTKNGTASAEICHDKKEAEKILAEKNNKGDNKWEMYEIYNERAEEIIDSMLGLVKEFYHGGRLLDIVLNMTDITEEEAKEIGIKNSEDETRRIYMDEAIELVDSYLNNQFGFHEDEINPKKNINLLYEYGDDKKSYSVDINLDDCIIMWKINEKTKKMNFYNRNIEKFVKEELRTLNYDSLKNVFEKEIKR